MLLAAASTTVAHASELVVLTAGVVKAVDRTVIISDQVSNVAAMGVDDMVFVSGVEVNTDDDSRPRARAEGR